eukprot:2961550-Heterocapsa_arctica.AAC.1
MFAANRRTCAGAGNQCAWERAEQKRAGEHWAQGRGCRAHSLHGSVGCTFCMAPSALTVACV